MAEYITFIKWGLFIIIMIVAGFKLFVEVQKFVKKFKKDDLDLDIDKI
ncbi:hypothetical protein LCGC14_2944880 [marine sediment metagenome]|uniref:Uncharacterized protein n=1 Tax=marine sediment metagenome TaxID=412755 RepID=A0A0F9A829_9ZZZZ